MRSRAGQRSSVPDRSCCPNVQPDGIAAPVQGDGAPGKKAVQTTAPTLRPVEYENPRTGQRFTGYAGISEGFEYNPGERQQREERQRDQFRANDRRLAASAGAPATPEGGMAVSEALDPHAVRGTVQSALPHVTAAIDRVHGAAGLPPTDVIMLPDDSERDGYYRAGSDRDRISCARDGSTRTWPRRTKSAT